MHVSRKVIGTVNVMNAVTKLQECIHDAQFPEKKHVYTFATWSQIHCMHAVSLLNGKPRYTHAQLCTICLSSLATNNSCMGPTTEDIILLHEFMQNIWHKISIKLFNFTEAMQLKIWLISSLFKKDAWSKLINKLNLHVATASMGCMHACMA